jgi:hypothetical protein
MRRSLTTLAAIAALTALPATAHATHPPLGGPSEAFCIGNGPATVPGLQQVSLVLPGAVPEDVYTRGFPCDDFGTDPIPGDPDIVPIPDDLDE